MSAEIGALRPRLANDSIGEPPPRRAPRFRGDNGGPVVVAETRHASRINGMAVVVMLTAIGGVPAFVINYNEITKYAEANGFTVENFFNALRDALS